MKFLRITDWADHYETAESRRIKDLSWVATPNGHDSVSFCQLLKHPNGMAHFGAWNLILQVASKCSTRGTLTYGKKCPRAHDAETIAELTHGSVTIIKEAIGRLLDMGWLEEIDSDGQESAGHALPSAGQATNTGQDRTGQDTGGRTGDAPAPDDGLSDFLGDFKCKTERAGKSILDEWRLATKGLKARQVREILDAAKPGIQWPSEFKKHREAKGV
jgi:hypothetical protein